MICELIRWGIRLGRESEAGRRSKEMVFGGLGGWGLRRIAVVRALHVYRL
jgi:hypothetical protein